MRKLFNIKRMIIIVITLYVLSGCSQKFLYPYCKTLFSPNEYPNFTNEGSQLILINYDHPLPDDYHVDLVTLENGEQIADIIYRPLMQMFNDMCLAGINPKVASGYRTYDEQMEILQQRTNEYLVQGYSWDAAQNLAQEWVALPDTSEHQTGLAVDINPLNEMTDSEELYRWLEVNSYRYGFIKRYPATKQDITKINNESWHYRYVGVTAATKIHEQNLCLEEYLSLQ